MKRAIVFVQRLSGYEGTKKSSCFFLPCAFVFTVCFFVFVKILALTTVISFKTFPKVAPQYPPAVKRYESTSRQTWSHIRISLGVIPRARHVLHLYTGVVNDSSRNSTVKTRSTVTNAIKLCVGRFPACKMQGAGRRYKILLSGAIREGKQSKQNQKRIN